MRAGGRRSAARAVDNVSVKCAGLVQKLDDPAPGQHVGKRHWTVRSLLAARSVRR